MEKSPLIVVGGNLTAVRYMDEILRPVVVPFVQQRHLILQQRHLIFQHDNARPHVARVCQDFLANHNINPLDWPPYGPDLYPIEHLWDELDRRTGRRNTPSTLDQLRTALLEEWNNISMRRINVLMNSIAQENQGCDRCARGAYEILTSQSISLCDIGGYRQMCFN